MEKTKVFIDPTSRLLYSSYYIQGLYEVLGKASVSFSSAYFSDLKRSAEDFSFAHYFAFVVKKPGLEPQKFVIDFCDPPDIHPIAYTWCDRYAKINFNKSETEDIYLGKLIPIPPGFGIRIWSLWETVYTCGKNYLKARNRAIIGQKRFIKDYFQQWKRPLLKDYLNPSAEIDSRKKPYIFIIASLWTDKKSKETTNVQRKNFMDTVRQMECNFEGGFYASPDHDLAPTYKDLLFFKPYSTAAYLAKTKASYLVFNTPAVHGCHGWKLAEYLAMGKAIISTPLLNDLVKPLKHEKEIHYVHQDKDLKNTLDRLFKDVPYKESLEKEAKAYYNQHAAPKAVINQMLQTPLPVDFLVKNQQNCPKIS
ncbi:MAG TPA: hypothetical protein ENH91_12365 [Leeuwenhoekiella sp.]|nr:hypothetical protein [Leeuwenhoekiella sp.]